jgi:hypothetical protein
MARPSEVEREKEEYLMLIHDHLDQAIGLDGQAASIVRQILNRWPQAQKFLLRLDEVLAQNLDQCDLAQKLIQEQLDEGQLKRSGDNRKKQ